MTSPLEKLCGAGGPIHREAPDAAEVAGLVRSGIVRLADAKRHSNSLESRFDLGYNAAHALCLAALRRAGYRPTNRWVVFQSLPHTLGLGADVWRVLDKCHRLRNLSEYEGDLQLDKGIVEALLAACDAVAAALGPVDDA